MPRRHSRFIYLLLITTSGSSPSQGHTRNLAAPTHHDSTYSLALLIVRRIKSLQYNFHHSVLVVVVIAIHQGVFVWLFQLFASVDSGSVAIQDKRRKECYGVKGARLDFEMETASHLLLIVVSTFSSHTSACHSLFTYN